MTRKKVISDEIREQVITIVEKYNDDCVPEEEEELGSLNRFMMQLRGKPSSRQKDYLRPGTYRARFKGSYLYLDRGDFGGRPDQMCRLKWTGDMESWEFAIYKYSSGRYDPDEWFFPGVDEVDGTVLGAIRATVEAYPD